MMNVILIITITTEGTLKNLQNNNTNSNKGNVHLSGEGHYENSSGSSVNVEQRLLTLRPSLPTSAVSPLCRLLLSTPMHHRHFVLLLSPKAVFYRAIDKRRLSRYR